MKTKFLQQGLVLIQSQLGSKGGFLTPLFASFKNINLVRYYCDLNL